MSIITLTKQHQKGALYLGLGHILLALLFLTGCGSTDQENEQSIDKLLYLSRVQKEVQTTDNAILFYTLAEEYIEDLATNKDQGLFFLEFADLYGQVFNFNKEKEYIERAIEAFSNGEEIVLRNEASLRLASLYQQMEQWEAADSLYRKGFASFLPDIETTYKYYIDYAKLKVTGPETSPEVALDILNRIVRSRTPLSVEGYGIYAYASALVGDNETCDRLLRDLHNITWNEEELQTIRSWEERIIRYRQESPGTENESRTLDPDLIRMQELLSMSVPQKVSNYFKANNEINKEAVRHQRMVFSVIILLLLILSSGIISLLNRKRRKEKASAESLLRLNDEMGKARLSQMQKGVYSLYEEHFSQINSLCEAYVKTDNRGPLYHKMQFLLDDLRADTGNLHRLEEIIDQEKNGIVSLFRKEFHASDQETAFLCYSILGLSNETIAALLGIDISTVYSRRYRIKKRIQESDNEHKELLLKAL